ncbi:DUF6891 domain-containing protein [Corynebacterium aquatimens]|uniref:DUF6891 domain-containing protein n=1 Tax=Corynebacterium aquatimens TaxID=1190508 RepID=A0A931DZ03_9CORY|nr:hypothetical protein [Corynebacterium aquatimens]MBG6121639.1 hypothetical protein [Corynebacterium aquatimens]WJY65822.1 hypothetical protein CAQUA_05570 [Corynebacterium aquatimens]
MTDNAVSHAMFTSKFPPSTSYPEAEKLENDICLQLAMGTPLSEVAYAFEDEFEIEDEWEAMRGDEPKPDDLQAVIDEVVAEYRRVVTKPSEDALRLELFERELGERSIAFSFNEGFDAHEGAVEGAERAEELGYNGYAYCHMQDVARLIESGELYIGYFGIDAEDEDAAVAIGRQVFETLTECGFVPEWDGTLDQRIRLQNLRWEVPVKED